VVAEFSQARARFRALHREGCFVLPNPWDVGTARLVQHFGFSAIASTSTGYAWSAGRPDYAVSRQDALALGRTGRRRQLAVERGFRSRFWSRPGRRRRKRHAGYSDRGGGAFHRGSRHGWGWSLRHQDGCGTPQGRARAAIDQTGDGVVLVARTEGLLLDPAAMSPAIKRLVAFADAGTDCLCAPGVRDRVDIAALVRAVAPKPVNVVMMRPGLSLSELVDLGVRRVSIGGPLARVVWAAVLRAARELKNGRFDALSAGIPAVALDAVSARSVLNNARHKAKPHYSCSP
jgi:2-methylisocitrate lyase-like PEP mutase family enzyme